MFFPQSETMIEMTGCKSRTIQPFKGLNKVRIPSHHPSLTVLTDLDSLRGLHDIVYSLQGYCCQPVLRSDTTLPSMSIRDNKPQAITGFQCFPLSNFKYYLTLFSKFFSSFPRGTCSLSVSRRYLALDEIYHLLRTAFPSYSTLRAGAVRGDHQVKDGILTLYDTLFQRIYTRVAR